MVDGLLSKAVNMTNCLPCHFKIKHEGPQSLNRGPSYFSKGVMLFQSLVSADVKIAIASFAYDATLRPSFEVFLVQDISSDVGEKLRGWWSVHGAVKNMETNQRYGLQSVLLITR